MPFPLALGLEGAGVIEALGPGVDGFSTGERVAWASAAGSYATEVLVRADVAVPVPEGIDPVVAGGLLLQGMTAHYLVHATFPLLEGQTCIVHAAAGGVGLLLCQLARKAGATVIGTASTDEKAALARRAGAHHVVLTARDDLEAEARRLTGGRGVDVVYDSVGKDTFDKSLRSLRPRGMLVLFGQSSGAVPPIDPLLLSTHGSLFVTRPTLAHYVADRSELLRRAGELFQLVSGEKLAVSIGERLPLAEAAQAHRLLASRKTSGKVMLLPRS